MTIDQCMHCKHRSVDSYTWGEPVGFFKVSLACDLTRDDSYTASYPPAPKWHAPDISCEKFELEGVSAYLTPQWIQDAFCNIGRIV